MIGKYVPKKAEEVSIGDVIFTEVNEKNIPISTYLILRDQSPVGLLVMEIETQEISIQIFNEEIIYVIENIFNLISDVNTPEYVWLGLEHGKYKVLVNLKELNIEVYNYNQDEWEELDSENILYEDDDETILVIVLDKDLKFKINLETLSVMIFTKRNLKYKEFYNFLLSCEGDYVFDSDNELKFTKGIE